MTRTPRAPKPAPQPHPARAVDPQAVSRQLARQQQVLALLLAQRGEPLGVDVLAERLGVSERTMERDLESLRAAHLPLRGRGGRSGGVWLEVSRGRQPLQLDDDQVMALVLALDFLGVDLPQRLAEARDHLRRHLDDPSLF